jgi:capsular polysaccharide biosynthesis protein
MDTSEGGCIGHWVWEAAIFLPYIKDIQKKETKPLKILLNNKRVYKTNILSDFGFYEADIIYSTNMVQDGNTWQEKYVTPTDTSYMMYVPKFFYLWNTFPSTHTFFEALHRFREFYISSIPPTTKTIPILYVARSYKENYSLNARAFVNMEEFRTMLVKNNVKIMEVDEFTSLTPQFQEILSANVIITEMGSAFIINGCFMASNSRIIVLNDMFNYHTCDYGFFQVKKTIMPDRKNIVDIFSLSTDRSAFSVDIPKFEAVVKSLQNE